MSAGQPLAFLLAALSLPLVAAYLHRRKRVRTTVPSAILFRGIAGTSAPNRRALARPRHLVSLSLAVLALLAGVHAVADLRGEAPRSRDVVIVLDTSTSMATRSSDGRTRLEHAQSRLSRLLSKLTEDDHVALVTAGADARIRTGFTRDHDRVLQMAAAQESDRCPSGLHAEDCASTAHRAMRVADAMCRRASEGVVVLLSDGVGVSVPSMECPIHHVGIGTSGSNVGVTGLSVREADALGLAEIYLQLTNAGPAREIEVELRVDDTVVDIVPMDLPQGETVEHLHRLELPPGEIVTARLRAPTDVLPADDVAAAARASGRRVSVLLVTETPRSFVADAFELHPRVDLTLIDPEQEATDEPHDLLVLETSYLGGPLPPAARIAALGTPPEELGLSKRGTFAAPEIVRWSLEHPLLRFVDLGELVLPRATTLPPDETEHALVDTDHGVLGALARWEGREVFYLGFAPAESDLVLRVGFVNLIANLVEWATPAARQHLPADDERSMPALPALESRIDPPARLGGTITGGIDRPSPSGRPWRLFVLLALGLLTLEWLLPAMFARRVGTPPLRGQKGSKV